MSDQETRREEINGYLRLALPLMAKHNIPATPKNYTTWFKHVSGSNAALTEAIDELISQGKEFTEEINDDLYWKFCAEKDEHELQKLREDIQQVLLTVLNEAAELCGETEKYGSLITHSVAKLSEDASVKEIRSVMGEILDETKAITLVGTQVQQTMEAKTVELETLQKEFEQAKAESLLDFLTNIPNRKAFNEKLVTLTAEAATEEKDLCLLIIDIDHFKKFNDEFGHIVGDEVLKFVARKINDVIRGWDFLARFGGEEFIVLLPQTPLHGATTVAENIRQYFSKAKLRAATTSKPLGKITVSIGISRFQPGEALEQFIDRADQALYLAKNSGRNLVSTESDLEP